MYVYVLLVKTLNEMVQIRFLTLSPMTRISEIKRLK